MSVWLGLRKKYHSISLNIRLKLQTERDSEKVLIEKIFLAILWETSMQKLFSQVQCMMSMASWDVSFYGSKYVASQHQETHAFNLPEMH